MTAKDAEAIVEELLAEIHGHRRRDLWLPHGFTVKGLTSEERTNPFAPSLLSHCRVTAELDVPIVYTPDSSHGIARASLPARRENLDALRDWITAAAGQAPAHVELTDWRVQPEDAPAPYLPSGEPNGPPADWFVRAELTVR